MKITKDNIITYGVVLFGSLLVAVGARIGAQSIGADDSTASITFWSAIILCFIAYLILQSAIEGGIKLLLKDKLPQQADTEPIIEEPKPTEEEVKEEAPIAKEPEIKEQVVKVVVEVEHKQPQPTAETTPITTESTPAPIKEPAPKSAIDVDAIRSEHLSTTQLQKQERLQIALDYTQREFAPYVSDSELKLLLENVQLYSERIIYNITPVRTTGLTNYDLYHFGWNIYNHFKAVNQLQTAEFIHQLFSFSLSSIESANTIRKKLRNEEAKIIKLRGNLSPEQ